MVEKYRVENNVWNVHFLENDISGFWKSVFSVKRDFDKCIRYYVNNGRSIKFWNEIWCGEISLREQFFRGLCGG